ncbi:MAG TPA: hypothetical protein VFA81_05645 [Burkholderiales bacterium]|nr:hypothetical protein [Burkholderiales bacterium]
MNWTVIKKPFTPGAGALLAFVSTLGVVGDLPDVPNANSKAPGIVAPSHLSVGLIQHVRAQGATSLENPMSIDLGNGNSVTVTHYGYYDDGAHGPAVGNVTPSSTATT